MTVKRRCFCVLFFICSKGGLFVNRSEKRRKRINTEVNRSQKQGYRSEKLSRRTIENLMGVDQPRYERHNHAVRRKGR
ncbi:hypothetical protein P343_07720 [Sporolactobacillus laevolacticus DSM 442]|uniref:Uncharacterized protein n=1 Tax=Sporolactobacillus laevolacticus DSM 442 TaxID=1395513 RepID=V6IXJ7_9BACL|nr:hypothetical protein P343_07720 [Sporolactobacillus laevolacticus DSM 442]